ncbi:GTPase IMAP family member 8 [Larimichthys crocea]|uniref:GTPase IMAP family member 8 n=1 Tax=Larimichthys crocea TaxID=215358 RepID=A0A6G0HJZ5_LARCR|nr:GTPase IMAP family member 8 [Larimichthys crocea]
MFKIDQTANSGTSECEAKTKSVNGRSITLIDTPGFFDTDRSEEELKPEIVRCITECAPGPHAFLIVLEVNKFTELEQAVINKIKEYFSEEAFKYATVVFTRGDQLPEGQTIEDYVRQNRPLSDLVKKCGGRCHVIDNKYWNQNPKHEYRSNQFQVEELLKTIERMVKENNGSCYTNEMLQLVEEEIEQEEENIRLLAGNMSEEEIREQAKANVSTKLWVRLAGIGTDRSEEKLKPEIVRCIAECAPGPHAFIIVLKVEKFTEQEQAVINKIKEYFSEEVFKYATVVFTHGDQLPEGQTIEDFIHQNKLVSDLVKKCGGRCHVIDNKYWNQNPKHEYRSNQLHVEELLNTVDKMVMENNERCYTNEMLRAVEKKIIPASTKLLTILKYIVQGGILGGLVGLAANRVASATTAVVVALMGVVIGGAVGYLKVKEPDTKRRQQRGQERVYECSVNQHLAVTPEEGVGGG